MYREVGFYLANGLTPNLATNAKFVVYGHECTAGLYIGYTTAPAVGPERGAYLKAARTALSARVR